MIKDIILTENMKNTFKKCYIINLDRRQDRYNNFLHRIPFNSNICERFSAIDGKNILKNKINENPFVIGCHMSHKKILQMVINDDDIKDDDLILIFEDDVIIPDNFIEQIKKLEKYFPPTWDIIYLGGCNIRGKKYNDYFLIPEIKDGHNYCCHAILFNKKTINT